MFRGSSRFALAERRKVKGESGQRPLATFTFYLLPFAFVALVLTGACRQKMANQPRYDPLESSDFFADGMSARPRVPGTVARGELVTDEFFATGKLGGQIGNGFPMPVTLDVVERGNDRFNVYCSPCHGRLGNGAGMIPSRGYRRPPSFHTDALRNQPTGHYFDVMSNGFGAMPQYGTIIPPRDRWAIIAYIRALQLSQNATVADVPADQSVILSRTDGEGSPAQERGGSLAPLGMTHGGGAQ